MFPKNQEFVGVHMGISHMKETTGNERAQLEAAKRYLGFRSRAWVCNRACLFSYAPYHMRGISDSFHYVFYFCQTCHTTTCFRKVCMAREMAWSAGMPSPTRTTGTYWGERRGGRQESLWTYPCSRDQTCTSPTQSLGFVFSFQCFIFTNISIIIVFNFVKKNRHASLW